MDRAIQNQFACGMFQLKKTDTSKDILVSLVSLTKFYILSNNCFVAEKGKIFVGLMLGLGSGLRLLLAVNIWVSNSPEPVFSDHRGFP